MQKPKQLLQVLKMHAYSTSPDLTTNIWAKPPPPPKKMVKIKPSANYFKEHTCTPHLTPSNLIFFTPTPLYL